MCAGVLGQVEMPRIELGSEKIHRQTSTSVVRLFLFRRVRPAQQGRVPASRFIFRARHGGSHGMQTIVSPHRLAICKRLPGDGSHA